MVDKYLSNLLKKKKCYGMSLEGILFGKRLPKGFRIPSAVLIQVCTRRGPVYLGRIIGSGRRQRAIVMALGC